MNFVVLLAFVLATANAANYCADRGGCTCDCSWATTEKCRLDDRSCCWGCCCGGTPTPPGPPGDLSLYCPSANDLTVAYGSPNLFDQGWSISGGGGVATKSAFNLLGGYVEYDIDISGVPTGVNANIYTVSPRIGGDGFRQDNYCDGAASGDKFCLEVDWIESNGNCGGATTLHTIEGPGNGCTAWGCSNTYHYNGRTSFHMRIDYGYDGQWTTTRDGQEIGPYSFSPSPQGSDWGILKGFYESKGAVIYSSQWTGWVPVSDCGTWGDLGSAYFSIKNLKVYGSVVQGPTPRGCYKALESVNATHV